MAANLTRHPGKESQTFQYNRSQNKAFQERSTTFLHELFQVGMFFTQFGTVMSIVEHILKELQCSLGTWLPTWRATTEKKAKHFSTTVPQNRHFRERMMTRHCNRYPNKHFRERNMTFQHNCSQNKHFRKRSTTFLHDCSQNKAFQEQSTTFLHELFQAGMFFTQFGTVMSIVEHILKELQCSLGTWLPTWRATTEKKAKHFSTTVPKTSIFRNEAQLFCTTVPKTSTFGNEAQHFCTIVPKTMLFRNEIQHFCTTVPKTSTFGNET